MKILLTSLVIFALGACAYPKKISPFIPLESKAGKSIVYIYRLPNQIDTTNPEPPIFYINDQRIGKLQVGGAYSTYVDPGDVEVSFANSLFGMAFWKSPKKVRFTAYSGESYYVEFGIHSMLRFLEFELIPKEKGSVDIQQTMLLGNPSILGL